MTKLLRRFSLILTFVLATAGWAQDTRHLTILHTSDLHARFLPDSQGKGGFAYVAAAIRKEKENCRDCLVLDAGDIVQGSPASTLFRGLPSYEVVNHFGIDVSTLGNHEFDYGWKRIYDFTSTASFPIVCANVTDDQGRFLTGKPYTIVNVNGIRVGLIGILMGVLLDGFSTPDLVGPWKVANPVETARTYARQLQDRTDLIIVLSHITTAEMDEMLTKAPEVSVIIAGHEHAGLETMRRVEDRVGVRVKSYGRELGRLELDIDMAQRKVVQAEWKRIEINEKITPAPDVAKLVGEWEEKVAEIVDEPIGESARAFSNADVKVLLERVMRDTTGADFAFMNLGGVRDVLPRGRLLARNVWNIMPFDNRVMIGRFKGKDLPAVVTKGKTIEPEKEYTLAVSDFTAENQKTQLRVTGLVFPQIGPLMRDAMIDWIRKQKILE
jgi:5'-nucleotidase/UDP-sugar diphosphatase